MRRSVCLCVLPVYYQGLFFFLLTFGHELLNSVRTIMCGTIMLSVLALVVVMCLQVCIQADGRTACTRRVLTTVGAGAKLRQLSCGEHCRHLVADTPWALTRPLAPLPDAPWPNNARACMLSADSPPPTYTHTHTHTSALLPAARRAEKRRAALRRSLCVQRRSGG